MRFVEFIGKDFLFLAAVGTFAHKRAEVLETFPSRAMSRCFHTLVSPFVVRYRPANRERPAWVAPQDRKTLLSLLFFPHQFALVFCAATGAENFNFLLRTDVLLLHFFGGNERYISTRALRTFTLYQVSLFLRHLNPLHFKMQESLKRTCSLQLSSCNSSLLSRPCHHQAFESSSPSRARLPLSAATSSRSVIPA